MSQRHPLDHEDIVYRLFYPRQTTPGGSRVAGTVDGVIPVEPDVELGYRLYVAPPGSSRAVLLFFHGNGEIAADYDGLINLYFEVGLNVVIGDFRGYGWGKGEPRTTTLLSDSEYFLSALPEILAPVGLDKLPLFVMGRSLGSGPAVYLAHKYPYRFRGLIIESGYADAPSLFLRLGLRMFFDANDDKVPTGSLRRMADLDLPVLVIHGEKDEVLPIKHGEQLYQASPSAHKKMLRIAGAGHNNLMMIGIDRYFAEIRRFIEQHGG